MKSEGVLKTYKILRGGRNQGRSQNVNCGGGGGGGVHSNIHALPDEFLFRLIAFRFEKKVAEQNINILIHTPLQLAF